MIEKVMRAVKSSNKKRGRNITIGAVVGMLLSCTAVMGADDYLWIRNNNGVIEFSTIDNNTGGDWKGNPYLDNSWNGKTYTNNIILSGSNSSGSGYGLKLSGNLGENFNLVNNGIISGSGSNSNSGYGVYSLNSTLRDIGNIGIIAGTNYGVYLYFDSSSNTTVKSIANNGIISGSNGYGVRLYSSSSSNITVESIVNTGIISGTSSNGPGHGVRLYSDSSSNTTVESMANNGIISGTGSSIGYGVFLNSTSSSNTTVESIVNTGIISGTGGSGYGVDLYSASTVKSIVNKGIIYGSTNAIYNNGGKITEAHNYGLLVNGKDDKVIKGLISGVQNYGLIFNAVGDEYTIDDTFGNNFGKKSEEDGYTVINVKVGLTSDPSGKKIDNNEIKSLKLTDGELSYYDLSEGLDTLQKENIDLNKKYILNGITDTLLVSTGDNRLNNSVINAYGNAVKFDETNGGELTLIGTVVNGGLKNPNDPIKANRTYAIKGSDKADTLTLQGKTVINGNIAMGTGADTLNIGNGVQINGILDGGTNALSDATTENDTLNFGVASNVKTTSSNEEIRILHNISNFENININSNVTFYESTIDTAGKIESLKVTGVENLTIGENGVLTLRIDSTKKDDLDTNKIIGHALYGAVTTVTSLALGTGTSISSTGGKLVLALNGAVENNIIDFGTTGLDMSTFVTREEGTYKEDVTLDTTSALHSVETYSEAKSSGILINKLIVTAKADLPMYNLIPEYEKLNEIYHSIISVKGLLGNFNVEKDEDEDMSLFLSYLNDIYAGNPYSYSSELSRKSTGMFRDRVTENQFKPNLNNWLIYGGLTHIDGGTKDTYYGKGYYTYDIGSSDIEADTKITGAYMLGEYGVSETLTSGVIIGGNKLKSDLFNGSKVDGDALYVGAYAKKYMGNLKVTAGAGFQYGDYDADRMAVNRVASSTGESVTKYSSNYNDITYDIYLNGRYSNPIGDNLFLEPYGTLSYTYIKQDGANEGNKTLAIETDSKSFDYTVGKVGVDLKKVIPHSTGKSTLTAGVSYTKIFDGAEEEYITGRFKGGTDFDILVAHKNQHSIGLNAKYALELENGVLFDVKGTYSVERDSHNNSGKNKTKGEWIVGAGLGYKF